MNLFLALAAEHKERTRHDVFKSGRFASRAAYCDVCLYLEAEWRDVQRKECEAMIPPPEEDAHA